MLARFLQQAACALDVCSHEWTGIQNRSIDVRFRGEIHDGVESMLFEDLSDVFPVRNVSAYESVSGIVRHFLDIAQIARISKEVEIHNFGVFARAEYITHETRSDKTRAAGDKKLHCCL